VIQWFLSFIMAAPLFIYIATIPPERFDHEYTGHLIEYNLSIDVIRSEDVCGTVPRDQVIACTYMDQLPNECTIFMPKVGQTFSWFGRQYTMTQGSYDSVKRHEIGHCNGWPPNHPE